MQAITTKYLGPTNHRVARVRAVAEAGSITVSWDHALNSRENHEHAAIALCNKLGWDATRFVGGGVSGGCVFVDTSSGPIAR